MTESGPRRFVPGRAVRALSRFAGLAVLCAACRENIVIPGPRPNPEPVLAAISPNQVSVDTSGFIITVYGERFTDSSRIQVGGEDRPTLFVNATTLTAQLGDGDRARAGSVPVAVFTPPPGGGTSDSAVLVVVPVQANPETDAPAPAISHFLPAAVRAGTQGQRLMIYGSGFTSRTVVQWNGERRPATILKDWKIAVSLAATDLDEPGAAQLTVATPGPGGGVATQRFPVIVNQPGHPTGWQMSSVFVGDRLTYAALGPAGTVYASRADADSIAVIDLAAPALLGSFAAGDRPGEIVVHPSGATAFVALEGSSAIGVIATASRRVTASYPLAAPPLRLRLDPAGAKLYATLADGSLAVLDAAGGAPLATVDLGAPGDALAFAPDGARLWIASRQRGTLTEVAAAGLAVTRVVAMGDRPVDLVVSGDGSRLYVVAEDGWIGGYDPATLALVAEVVVPGATALGLTPDGTQLWVTRTAAGRVAVIETAGSTLLGELYTTGAPRHVLFDATGSAAFVTNAAGGVQVIR